MIDAVSPYMKIPTPTVFGNIAQTLATTRAFISMPLYTGSMAEIAQFYVTKIDDALHQLETETGLKVDAIA